MSLAEEYQRQFNWRDWPTIFAALPDLEGQTVLDLGCGVGDLSALLVARGARVIGFDASEELLREAKSRGLPRAEFHTADLRSLPETSVPADGIWSSFSAAYFPDLSSVLAAWSKNLRATGWIALIEMDDLFGHEPLEGRTKALLDGYAEDALAAGTYDFHMGRKLNDHLDRAGFAVAKSFVVGDRELSFQGPAEKEVVSAWGSRFDRMKLLREFCGQEFERVRTDFLGCLARPDHRSQAKIYCSIGARR